MGVISPPHFCTEDKVFGSSSDKFFSSYGMLEKSTSCFQLLGFRFTFIEVSEIKHAVEKVEEENILFLSQNIRIEGQPM